MTIAKKQPRMQFIPIMAPWGKNQNLTWFIFNIEEISVVRMEGLGKKHGVFLLRFIYYYSFFYENWVAISPNQNWHIMNIWVRTFLEFKCLMLISLVPPAHISVITYYSCAVPNCQIALLKESENFEYILLQISPNGANN